MSAADRSSAVVGESIDRGEHPLLDLRVEPLEVSVRAPFKLDRPAGKPIAELRPVTRTGLAANALLDGGAISQP